MARVLFESYVWIYGVKLAEISGCWRGFPFRTSEVGITANVLSCQYILNRGPHWGRGASGENYLDDISEDMVIFAKILSTSINKAFTFCCLRGLEPVEDIVNCAKGHVSKSNVYTCPKHTHNLGRLNPSVLALDLPKTANSELTQCLLHS
jgi:hypothetical protein